MAFDKDSDLPLIQPKKRTTKVNFAIAIAVIVFLTIAGAVTAWYAKHPRDAGQGVEHAAPK